MITVTMSNGREYNLKENSFYKNAEELARIIDDGNSIIKVHFVLSKDNEVLMASHIVSLRDK